MFRLPCRELYDEFRGSGDAIQDDEATPEEIAAQIRAGIDAGAYLVREGK